MGSSIVAGLVSGSIYGLIALGIVMVYRGSKVLNFAQVEIGTFGLYVAHTLVEDHGQPWLVGAAAALLVVAAMSAAFERIVVRSMVDRPRVTVAVATIGLLLLLIALEIKVWDSSPRFLRGPIAGTGPEVFGYFVKWTEIVAFLVAAAVGLGLNAFLRRTDFGLGVLASSQDPTALRMMGVSLARVSLFTWVTAGVLGGVAVLLFEPTVGAFAPGTYSVGAVALFVPALAAALLGRLVNLTHAFLGGLAIGVIEQLVKRWFADVTALPNPAVMAVFALIIAALLLRPAPSSVRGEVA